MTTTVPPVAIAIAGVLTLIVFVLIVLGITDRKDLPTRQRWGFVLGALFLPFIFLPLYLILTPPKPETEPASGA